ncbi:hypothetical protein C5167_029571 [Papaver somniferum]|nr:hypothetical protein C5167_029571 [Papaver somniferum]
MNEDEERIQFSYGEEEVDGGEIAQDFLALCIVKTLETCSPASLQLMETLLIISLLHAGTGEGALVRLR